MRPLLHRLYVWRWPARVACHGTTRCCQYYDNPNCNNPGAPRGRAHR